MVKAPSIEKPATAEDVARRLREAADAGLAVVPVGGGGRLGGGRENPDGLSERERGNRPLMAVLSSPPAS